MRSQVNRFAFPRSAWLLLTLAVALRIVYLLIYFGLPDWSQLTVDANFHHNWAQRLASGDWSGGTTFFRAPLYPYALGLLYWIAGASLWVGRIVGLFIGTASVALTYVIGRRLFGHRSGIIAMFLHAVYPMALYFEPELLVEPLFLLLSLISIDRLTVWQRTGRIPDIFWFAVAAGLASITRPTGLLLLLMPLMVMITRRTTVPQPLLQLAALLLGCIVTIGPVTLRNVAVAGDATLIASSGGVNLYIGNNDDADGVSAVMPAPLGPNWRLQQVKFVAEQADGHQLTWGAVSSYWTGQALDWIASNPGRFAQLYLAKLYLFVSAETISNNRELPPFFESIPLLRLNPFRFWLILPLAVIGLLASAWSTREVRPVIVYAVLYILVGALFFYSLRFRYPLLPILFILAGFGSVELERLRRTDTRKTLLLMGAGIIVGIFSLLSLAPLPTDASTHALTERGIYEYSQGNYRAAVQYQRAAIQADPDFPGVHTNLGASYIEMQQLDSAAAQFQQELQLHPWHNGAVSNLAYTFLLSGDLRKAQEYGRQAVKNAPWEYGANIILIRALAADSAVDNTRLTLETLDAARRTDNSVFLLNDMGAVLLERGLVDQAEELFERAMTADPPPIETDDEAFRHNFRHSERMMDNQRARAAVQLGYISGMKGQVQQALIYSQKALEYDASVVGGWVNLYHAYQSLGQPQQAAEVLREMSRRFPSDPTVRQLQRR